MQHISLMGHLSSEKFEQKLYFCLYSGLFALNDSLQREVPCRMMGKDDVLDRISHFEPELSLRQIVGSSLFQSHKLLSQPIGSFGFAVLEGFSNGVL